MRFGGLFGLYKSLVRLRKVAFRTEGSKVSFGSSKGPTFWQRVLVVLEVFHIAGYLLS